MILVTLFNVVYCTMVVSSALHDILAKKVLSNIIPLSVPWLKSKKIIKNYQMIAKFNSETTVTSKRLLS